MRGAWVGDHQQLLRADVLLYSAAAATAAMWLQLLAQQPLLEREISVPIALFTSPMLILRAPTRARRGASLGIDISGDYRSPDPLPEAKPTYPVSWVMGGPLSYQVLARDVSIRAVAVP